MNSPLMDALRKFSDIVFYNLLFCLFSLPVVTAGASLCALCEGMQKLAAGEDSDLPVFRTFWDTFKRTFKRATILWFICIFGYFFLSSLQYAAVTLSGGAVGTSYMVTFYAMTLLLVFGFQNLFPSLARWQDLGVVALLFRTYLVAGVGFPWTLLGILCTGVFSYVTLGMNMNIFRFGLFLWAVCGFGIVTYLSSFFFLRAAAGYEKQQEVLQAQKQAAEETKENATEKSE